MLSVIHISDSVVFSTAYKSNAWVRSVSGPGVFSEYGRKVIR